ncbi:hypothetical protein [Jeotgalibacillus proteolyticus]|uniref:Uncharacterized protein n=1 Tax=Jeotgalibacillus proteolyticus TaxID=2082395 RepID=A0A2S5G9B4_9BACL|nr:hypothetical protein [Jeotgalibacillus proteolyticus]PPA69511.1 hypothetical protein C4B60_13235 [Jeotgalibacillus proteolyticus]
MTAQDYHFSIRYKDFEYSVTGDEAFITRHEEVASSYLNKLMSEKQTAQATAKPSFPTANAPITPTYTEPKHTEETKKAASSDIDSEQKNDIQAFLEELPIGSEWQYTLAMAYYLFKHRQQQAFTAKSIRKQFRDARHNVPNNIHLSIHTCVKKGYLHESGLLDLQKNYEITEAGIQYVNELVTNKAFPESKPTTGRSRSDRREKLLAFSLDELNLEHNPNPQTLERLEDQALSILYIYKRELDFMYLSAQDVYDILTELFSLSHSPKAVQIALSRSRPRVEKIKVDGQMNYQLTPNGNEYMEKLLESQYHEE